MARSREYWEERFADLEEAQSERGAEYFAELEKQYKRASASVQRDIERWYARFADNNEISIQEARKLLSGNDLEEFRWNVMDYIEKGRTLNISDQWARQLENASARVHISRLEAIKLQMQNHVEVLYGNEMDEFSEVMREIYTEGYYHTAYEIQKGFNIGYDLMRLDTNKVEKVLSRPWAADGSNFSDRIWKQKSQLVSELHNNLTQAIMRGQNPHAVTEAIAKRFNVSRGQAGRLVMTESAFFNSASNRDCYKDLGVEQFEILATLDKHTSDICQSLDGKVFPMSEYAIGVTAPPFHVWCRTTTVPFFDDEFELGSERTARDEDGKTYYVPSDMKYEDWKNTFVDGGSKDGLEIIGTDRVRSSVQKMNSEDTIEDLKKQFSDMTDGYSYDDFIKDFDSIEDGFEGSDDEIIKKAKEIDDKIQSLKNRLNNGNQSLERTIHTRQESIEILRNLGIKFEDSSTDSISDEILSKYADFISDFESTHPGYFARNKLGLSSVTIVDDLKVNGKTAAGAYYSNSQSIELMKKAIGTRPASKLITYSNSDDFEMHFFAHEYGHFVADSLEKTFSITDYDIIQNSLLRYFDGDIFKAKTSNLVDVLGSYGSKNAKEAFAEAFAEAYTCKEPRQFARIFREELEQALASYNTKIANDIVEELGESMASKVDDIAWGSKGTRISNDQYKEVMSYARNRGIELSNFKQYDGDVDNIYTLIDDAEEVAKLYPEITSGRRRLTINLDSNMDSRDFAITRGHIISINANAYRDVGRLQEEYQKLVEERWFVQGTDFHSIIKHEIGHVVANYYDIDGFSLASEITGLKPAELMEYLESNLSEYSASHADGREIVAECFSCMYGTDGTDNEFVLKFMEEYGNIIKNR